MKFRYFIITFSILVLSGNSIIFFAKISKENTMKLTVTSTAFNDGGMIPSKYTCDGDNISPAISWSGIPGGTKSIAMICEDPDAPAGTWVHWVVYNIPPDIQKIEEKIPSEKILKNGTLQGLTDFRKIGYGGPCPPSGVHRYYFKVYALDKTLDLEPGATKSQLVKAMEGHILAQGQLMGKYTRK